MVECQNCGQINTESGNFCRFCGTKFMLMQFQNGNRYEFEQPRPYSWKTDEFQINNQKPTKFKTIPQVQPLVNGFQSPPLQSPVLHRPQQIAHGYRCPRCNSQHPPRMTRRISTAGWIVFAIFLVAFFPLFWIGFFIKEEIRICPMCNLNFG